MKNALAMVMGIALAAVLFYGFVKSGMYDAVMGPKK